MINKFKKTLLCSALAMLTVACSNSVENDAQADVEGEVQVVDSTANVATDNQPDKAPEVQEKTNVPSMPLEDYIDINSFKDKSYLTPLFLAQTTRDISDEDKLGLMSAEYHNERDQFKKSDLGKSLLPEVNKEIDKYKGDFGIKIPFGATHQSYNPYHSSYTKYASTEPNSGIGGELINIHLKPYSFDRKEFPISQCTNTGNGSFVPRQFNESPVQNEQNIKMHFVGIAPEQATFSKKNFLPDLLQYRYDNLYCALNIEDQEKAREIEGLRTNEQLDTKGFFYYKVTANENMLIAQPVYAKFTLYNINTGEDLATREFTWNDEDRL